LDDLEGYSQPVRSAILATELLVLLGVLRFLKFSFRF